MCLFSVRFPYDRKYGDRMQLKYIVLRIAIIIFWLGVIFAFVTQATFFKSASGNSINICVEGMFDLQWIARFEKETGIQVNISYYESNEELLVKLLTTHDHGYDLIIPSDYTVHILRKKGMLKKIDKDKLLFYKQLNPVLMGHYFDRNNEYSVPFEWSVYGLGINKSCSHGPILDDSWALVFDKKYIDSHKIMMTNDPLVAVPLAAFYLFGTMDTLTKEDMGTIERLLRKQHASVEAYTDFRASYYLASKNACIAVCPSSYILKSMRAYKHLDFIMPREGSLLTIESFALPSQSNKEDLVYAFMNFMMKPESVIHSYEHIGFFPATMDALDQLNLDPHVRPLLTLSKKEFERFHLVRFDVLKRVLTDFELQDLWVRVKA